MLGSSCEQCLSSWTLQVVRMHQADMSWFSQCVLLLPASSHPHLAEAVYCAGLSLPFATIEHGMVLLLHGSQAAAACRAVHVPPRPVPNLGYACLNNTLQQQKPMVSPQGGACTTSGQAKQMPALLPFSAGQGCLGSV